MGRRRKQIEQWERRRKAEAEGKDSDELKTLHSQNKKPNLKYNLRACMLDRLPGNNKPQKVESPVLEPGKVLVCILEWEGATHKRDLGAVRVEESIQLMRGTPHRHFGCTREIDTPKSDCAARVVLEPRPVDMKRIGRSRMHALRLKHALRSILGGLGVATEGRVDKGSLDGGGSGSGSSVE